MYTDPSIRKALDDQGQTLAPISDGFHRYESLNNVHHVATAHLKLGKKQAKTLKQLQGVVSAKALTPNESVVGVVDILHASGRTVKAKNGGSLQVLEVTQQPGGIVQLHVRMTDLFSESSPSTIPSPVRLWANQAIVPGQRFRAVLRSGTEPPLLSLLDAKGTALPMVPSATSELW